MMMLMMMVMGMIRVDVIDSFLCVLHYRYDHEQDDDYEHMQKAETHLLRHFSQFLPRAFAPATPATDTDLM